LVVSSPAPGVLSAAEEEKEARNLLAAEVRAQMEEVPEVKDLTGAEAARPQEAEAPLQEVEGESHPWYR